MPVAEYMGKKVIIVNRGGKWYIRAYPERPPTENQLKARRLFAEAAKRARGRRMTGDIPPAAEEVARIMRGVRIGRTPRPRKWEIAVALAISNMSREEAERLIRAYEASTPYIIPDYLRRRIREIVREKIVFTLLPVEERERRLPPPRGGFERMSRRTSMVNIW